MNEIDVIGILDPVTDEVVTHCFGPTTAGKCPLASPDGIVHCHGARMIALDGRGLSKHRGAELGAGVLESLDPAGIYSLSLDVAPSRSRPASGSWSSPTVARSRRPARSRPDPCVQRPADAQGLVPTGTTVWLSA